METDNLNKKLLIEEPEDPLIIYVSGMPFYFRGWNGKYCKHNDENYHLVNHNYFGIQITHTYIKYYDGKWYFYSENMDNPIAQSSGENICDIMQGDDRYFWFLISKENSIQNWINNNVRVIGTFCVLAVVSLLMYYTPH